MESVTTVAAMRAAVSLARARGETIGLVPTMGFLHAGHLELVRRARRECNRVVVSIFVNPLQFGPREDYERYPRDLEGDRRLLQGEGVDLLFTPAVEEMYPPGFTTVVEVAGLGDRLCGRSRPGHFRGVATVVTKLLNIVTPDRAYFGAKDAQQLILIRRLAADLDLAAEIVSVPTVREPDGLALSSRNAYLSPAERAAATVLYRALQAGEAALAAGERLPAAVEETMLNVLRAEPLARPDYAAVVRQEDLEPAQPLEGKILLAVAAWVGPARLIDNLPLLVEPDGVTRVEI